MNRTQLLLKAKAIIETQLNTYIISTEFNENTSNLKITLLGGITLYIRYNDYQEYSYTIQFSLNKFDRIRFDNFDKGWGVETDPHHVHLRFQKNAHKSLMSGILENDLQTFIDEILKSLNFEL
ncbi:MAG: DUF6516 family protein [Candidatus Heimdallarchaeota archaeon]